jgi:hypothetical protein
MVYARVLLHFFAQSCDFANPVARPEGGHSTDLQTEDFPTSQTPPACKLAAEHA